MASVWDQFEAGPSRKAAPDSRSVWDQFESGVRPPKSITRNPLEFANDTVVTGVNSALGIGKAVSDFVSVDNPVSRGLQYIIDEGEKTYSDKTRADREALNQAIDAGGWDAAKGVGEFIITSPVQAAAMAAGNFGPFGAVIKGARGLAAASGLGAKGVSRAGLGSASVLGGAAAGGDAAGDAYEQVMRSPNIDPTIKEELARQAAREASAIPAVIGAATPFLPGSAESQIARGLGITRASIPRAAASEFGQEFIEEGATKASANLAAQQYDPTIDASKGVFGSALLGGVLGAGTGAGVTYLNNRAVQADLLRRDEAVAAQERARQEQLAPILGLIRQDSGVGTQDIINQQLGITPALADKELDKQRKAREADILAAFNEPSGVRVVGQDGQERELSAIEAALMQQGLPTAPTPAPAPAPAAPASKVYTAEEQELISMGVVPNGKALELLAEIKASGLPAESLTPVITAMTERKNAQAKKLLAQAIIESKKAPAAAPAVSTVAPTAPAVSTVAAAAPAPTPAAAPASTVAQAPGVTSLPVPEVPANVQASQAQQAEAPAEAAVAAAPAQGAAAAAAEPVVVRRKRRVVDPAALQQSQAFVAPEATEEQAQTEAPAQDAALSFEDQLAAAQATGNAGEIQAEADELSGARQDAPVVNTTEEERKAAVSEILKLRFADSKDPQRDAEIAQAYLTALRDAPQGSKVKVQEAIGEQFGIKPVAVRKIGNTTEMVKAGEKLGYSAQQTLELLGVNDNAKKAAAAAPQADEGTPDLAGALKQVGVETTEEDGAGFGLDDDRAYTGAAFDSSGRPIYGDTDNARTELLHNNIVGLVEKIEKLKTTAAELAAQGKPEVAAKVAQERERIEASLAKLLQQGAAQKKPAKATKASPAAPATGALSDEAKAASSKFKAAGLNLDAMDDAELPALREAAARFKNTELMAKIDRRMGVEPVATRPAATEAKEDDAEERLVLDREKAAAAWDRAADRSEGAIPAFEELTDEQQATFIGFGKNNWKLADINRFAEEEGLINEVQANDDRSDDMRFGKNKGSGAVKNGYTAAELTDEIKAFIRADVLGRKLVIVDTIGDLLTSSLPSRRVVGAALALEGAYGVATDGTAYLVADRIKKGSGRAKFMHEVGAHLGLENLLPKAVYDRLVDQIDKWAKQDGSTEESKLAKKAAKRVKDAGTKQADVRAETLAYFIEEAVQSGIDPTAEAMRASSELRQWFRTLWAAFKTAVRRLGFKPETMSAQDVVNLAFGAARLEIAGTWHGTAALFRRFDHKFMSSGEGAQAFGWGTYLAQNQGVGNDYFDSDVLRKFVNNIVQAYGGDVLADDVLHPVDLEPISVRVRDKDKKPVTVELTAGTEITPDVARALAVASAREGVDSIALVGKPAAILTSLRPAGALMRVDTSVGADETLDWDAPMSEQPQAVQDFAAKNFPGETRIEKGSDLYKMLIARAWKKMGVAGKWDDPSLGAEKMQAAKRASEALDAAGVKALKFLDAGSRAPGVAPEDQTRNLVIFNDKNIFRVGAQVDAYRENMRFGKDLREKLPAELQKPVGTITNVLRDTKNLALNALTFTEDVINRAVDMGLEAAADLRRIYQERAALTGKLEREVERVADLYNKVPEAERGTGPRSVNSFLYDSTREGKWGFKPKWRKGTSANVTIDADMKRRYDALSKESKALVEAIFRHGDEVLALKKQTVIDATNSEYDALIAAANKLNDAKKAARLTADKADQLKRFDSLFALQEFRPYAPLKRFGDYVVIARSQKYLDADEKARAKLENSEDDYHVSFAESAAAAREMVEQLNKQGAFAEVVFRQKEAVQQTMFGGMMSAFNKLRSELDSELADAQPGEKAAIRAARKVIGELYLSSLAEASARKSEMRRRGVAGEIDVLRSFTTQGRADAQFIAGAKYNNQTLDVFNQMRREVKAGGAEAQNEKSGVFNELLKRHTQSMEYDPSPISSKLARLTSIWYLATSPAYYLQNLTQPFMMSLPVMTAKHNYLKAANALIRAYSDLAPMFRTAKLGEQFNYEAAPQDVRAAISTLVDRGRIDIGMDTDLGTFRLEGEGPVKDRWNKVDRGIRNVAQKMEAVNRLATAIAAYRMELAKTGNAKGALEYADSIISQTHGDYTTTNAPRVFNTATGKVALQFRKFQLIQLTLLAKLVKNSFTGDDRMAAFTALSFLLGHTAVMAGAIGLPGFAAISWLLGAVMGGGDDEPFNLEEELRKSIGNEQLATLITRGVPAALGVDLSQKLGSGNVLSLLPFNDLDLSSRSGVESAAFAAFGGPAGGLTLRAVDGLSLMRDGQYYRGLEQLVPTGVTNAMRAYRTAEEGVTRRNGDVLISPEEISGMESFWQAIGFQPTELALRQFRDTVKRDADQKFQSRAEKIRNAYLRAKDDPEARAEARERWAALQDAREEAGYRRQPLSSLMRAEQNQIQRERNTLGGIQFNRDTRRFVEELTQE